MATDSLSGQPTDPESTNWDEATQPRPPSIKSQSGDTIRATVGPGSKAVAVGKDIDLTVIEKVVNVFRLGAWQVGLLVLVIGALIILAIRFQQLLAPTPKARVMDRRFNVAIADFGQVDDPAAGTARESEDGQWLAKDLNTGLEALLPTDPELSTLVDVQHEHIGLIRGDAPELRQQAAAELAQQIAADVVIYGFLDTSGLLAWFVPEFYVSPRLTGAEESYDNSVAAGAEDHTETSPFGSRLEVRLPLTTSAVNRAALVAEVMPRLEALIQFIFGLAFFKADNPDMALRYFEAARSMPEWEETRGKEILYLWIGSALHHRALAGSRKEEPACPIGEDETLNDWQCAKAAYDKALQLDPQFARAHIGLGNLWADQAEQVHEGRPLYFCNAYDRAVEEYRRSLGDSMDALETAHVDLKAHFNTGLTYARAYRNGCGDEYQAPAVDALTLAISAFEASPDAVAVQRIGAKAFYHLGMVHLAAGEHDQAVEAFARAVEAAQPNSRYEETWHTIRWHAYDQMGYAYSALARAGDDARWQDAIDAFNKVVARQKEGKFDDRLVLSSTYYGLGVAYSQTSQYEEALEALDAAVTLVDAAAAKQSEPWQAMRWVSHLERGHALAALALDGKTGRWPQALAAYDEVTAQFETGSGEVIGEIAAEAYCHAGLAHEALGATAQAKASYETALTTVGISQEIMDIAQERLQALGGP